MPQAIRSATPRARKSHRCSCCSARIPAGTTYRRDTYVFDGRVYDWLTCEPCSPLDVVVWDWAARPDEGVMAEDYEEWAVAHRDDPEHAEVAQAFLARWAQAGEENENV